MRSCAQSVRHCLISSQRLIRDVDALPRTPPRGMWYAIFRFGKGKIEQRVSHSGFRVPAGRCALPVSSDKWFEGVNFEVGFWQNYLNTKGGPWPEDFRARLDPNCPFDSLVEAAIRHSGSSEIEILDVGSGPLTSLGYVSRKFGIRITAVDPLADAYAVLLQEAGLKPVVQTQQCFAENLLQHFGARRFDVCHSRNALDHSLDPLSGVLAMAQLLRPQGLLYIRVHRNEGENACYSGLHNWNFDTDDKSNFILWRGAECYSLSQNLSDFVEGQVTELKTAESDELIYIGYRKPF